MRHEGYVHGFEIDADHSLHIYQGSLVRVQADALVSSDDNFLSAGGGVSRALANAAGFDVARERQHIVQEHRPKLGEVVRTSGGGLPCRHLYHAITIDDDCNAYMDETALRKLIANLLKQATADGVRSIGMPALGTGAACFELGRASEIIIDELLVRLVDTPIQRVILALMGDEVERLFYERIVRTRAKRMASLELRRRELTPHEVTDHRVQAGQEDHADTERFTRFERPTQSSDPETPAVPAGWEVEGSAAVGEIIEQFPKLIDEDRLSSTPPSRPKLVDGLADVILKHADPDDIERELLSLPACRGFRGTLKQRLMEFLYLSEDNLRTALGPALFKNKDLRQMVKELGEESDLPRDQDQLLMAILRALCFNTLTPPVGIGEYIARLERLLADLRGGNDDERSLVAAAIEAGKILEQALKDLIRMYGFLFFGSDFEAELVRRKVIAPRRDGNHVSRLTIGQALEALEQLSSLMNQDAHLKAKWRTLGSSVNDLLPREIGADQGGQGDDCRRVLREIIATRNDSVHTGGTDGAAEPGEVVQRIQKLHAFFCACHALGVYPDVLRYEGTYENRNGERFVYFLDEKSQERKVRTDERVDARRHYYCFATNNPIHLYPTLIPKL
jgi:O-acetyl-ADP-ribose deacetylase (regulator of RNase III)